MRIIEKDSGVTASDQRFIWCGPALCEERSSSGGTVARRFLSQGVQDSGTSFFYTHDHLKSPRELTDSTGALRARYDYDPWGRRTKLTGDLDSGIAYSGHWYHSASALLLAPFRAYDADLGRWIAEDPSGYIDGPNVYQYVGGNVIGFTDPLGLELVRVTLPGLGPTYVDDSFLPQVNSFIAGARERGVEPHFNSAFRTIDKQKSLKNDPNATTPADVSLHSAGFAFDVDFKVLSKTDRQKLLEAAREANLTWGGKFKKPDPQHFFHEPLPRKPGESPAAWKQRRQDLVNQAQHEWANLNRGLKCPVK